MTAVTGMHAAVEKSRLFLRGCEIRSGREAWVRTRVSCMCPLPLQEKDIRIIMGYMYEDKARPTICKVS